MTPPLSPRSRAALLARLAPALVAVALVAGCVTVVAPPDSDAIAGAVTSTSPAEPTQPVVEEPETPAQPSPTVTELPTEPSATPSQPMATPSVPEETVVTPDAGSASKATALVTLKTLPVKGRAPKTGYARQQFGSGWLDPDRNGCDTRNDILNRDLTKTTFKPGTRDCIVLTGVLADPFSGTDIAFQRGQSTSTLVQIDHIVALSNAWQTGAQKWSPAHREGFANDPLNLLAVSGRLNGQKSDSDAASWLPPNKANRCPYVARQVAVKAKWGGWVTPPERAAMASILATCPNEPLPAGALDKPVLGTGTSASAPAPKPTRAPAPKPSSAPKPKPVAPARPSSPFKNCTAARDAGAAPVYLGDPGYGPHLDRDGDGVGCE